MSKNQRATQKRARKVLSKTEGRRPKVVTTAKTRERAVELLTVEQIEEDLYLHGLIDTQYPSRGPGGYSNAPTMVVSQSMSTTIGIADYVENGGDYDTLAGARWNGTNWITHPPYAADFDRSLAVVINPQPNVTFGDASDPSTFRLGYTTATDKRQDQPTLDYNITEGNTCPLPNFPYGTPGINSLKNGSASDAAEVNFETPRRCVGMSASITVNQPALDCQGEIYAGSNQDYSVTRARDIFAYVSADEIAPAAHDLESPLAGDTFGNLSNFRYVTPTKSFTNGTKVEAHWLPVSDAGLEYITTQRCVSFATDAGAPGHQSKVQNALLASSPALVFVLKNLNFASSKPSITIACRVNWEVAIKPTMSVGWLLAECRLARRYLVDWGQVSNVRHAGSLGHTLASHAESRFVHVARAIAKGHVPPPPLLPAPTQQGPTPSEHTGPGAAATKRSKTFWQKAGSFVGDVASHINADSISGIGEMLGGAVTRKPSLFFDGVGRLLRSAG